MGNPRLVLLYRRNLIVLVRFPLILASKSAYLGSNGSISRQDEETPLSGDVGLKPQEDAPNSPNDCANFFLPAFVDSPDVGVEYVVRDLRHCQ